MTVAITDPALSSEQVNDYTLRLESTIAKSKEKNNILERRSLEL